MVTMEFYGVKLMASTSQIKKKTWSEVDGINFTDHKKNRSPPYLRD